MTIDLKQLQDDQIELWKALAKVQENITKIQESLELFAGLLNKNVLLMGKLISLITQNKETKEAPTLQ